MRRPGDSSSIQQQRERDLSEQLLGDSRLRGSLTDTQAGILFDWALVHIRELAARTAYLPDEDADPIISQRFTAVRTIIKLVHEIMDSLAQSQADLAIVPQRVDDDMTLRLFKTLRWLEDARITPERLAAMRAFNAQRPYTDADEAFHKLMAVIHDQAGD